MQNRILRFLIILILLSILSSFVIYSTAKAAPSPTPYNSPVPYGSTQPSSYPSSSPSPTASAPSFSAPPKKELKPRLNVNSLSLVKKKKYTIRVYNTDATSRVTYRTSNTRIVPIYKTGAKYCKIRAKRVGSATITFNIRRNSTLIASLTCTVTVGPPAISIKFKKSTARLTVGTTRRIKAIVKPGNTKELPRYQSDDPSIVRVSSNGTVSVIAPGTTTITASIASGREASYEVIATMPEGMEDEGTSTSNYNPSASPSASPAPTSSSPNYNPNSYYYDTNR